LPVKAGLIVFEKKIACTHIFLMHLLIDWYLTPTLAIFQLYCGIISDACVTLVNVGWM
jgi:hypothetical protein